MDAPRPTSDLTEPGAPDGMDGTDEATASVRQRGTAVPVSTGPGSARPTSELAADVREASAAMADLLEDGIDIDSVDADDLRARLVGSVDALVARITDLEAQQRRWLAWSGGDYPDDSPGDVIRYETDGTIVLDDGITTWSPLRALAAAEAQVAALTQERDQLLSDRARRHNSNRKADYVADCVLRAEAAEAALADMRQALSMCGDLLFGTWDDHEAKRQAYIEAEAAARRALAAADKEPA